MLESLRERLGRVLVQIGENLRPARAVLRRPSNAIDDVADIDMLAAASLNAGSCVRVAAREASARTAGSGAIVAADAAAPTEDIFGA